MSSRDEVALVLLGLFLLGGLRQQPQPQAREVTATTQVYPVETKFKPREEISIQPVKPPEEIIGEKPVEGIIVQPIQQPKRPGIGLLSTQAQQPVAKLPETRVTLPTQPVQPTQPTQPTQPAQPAQPAQQVEKPAIPTAPVVSVPDDVQCILYGLSWPALIPGDVESNPDTPSIASRIADVLKRHGVAIQCDWIPTRWMDTPEGKKPVGWNVVLRTSVPVKCGYETIYPAEKKERYWWWELGSKWVCRVFDEVVYEKIVRLPGQR